LPDCAVAHEEFAAACPWRDALTSVIADKLLPEPILPNIPALPKPKAAT